MDDLDKISEIVEENMNFIQEGFEEAIAELEYKEEELKMDKESVTGSFKGVDSIRESVDARLLQVVEKEKDFRLLQENGLRLFELKKGEVDLILEDVKVREEKLDKKEKMVQGFFERIELEIKKFECIQKSMEERFDEISLKERQVENRSRELKLIENEIERKAIEIHNKEEKLETRTKNFVSREKALALKEEELVAKENGLETREMVLATRKEELVAKQNELELREKMLHLKTGEENESANLVNGGKGEWGLPKVDAAHLRECRELRSIGKKRARTDSDNAERVPPERSKGKKRARTDSDSAVSVPPERNKGNKRARTDSDNVVSVPPDSTIRTNVAKTTALNSLETEYADPEFHDFDKDRKKSCFAVDQFWACYDTVDAMPRFYFQIKKVYSRKFKLHVTWLEAVQENQCQVDSLVKDLPVACGKFIYGNSEDITDIRSCSHQIHCEEDRLQGSYMIYPRKGETWALFKDLDIRKKSNSGSIEQYEYEIVVVLSNFVEITGIRVAYLDKLEGYVSLFHRKRESTSFLIRPSQLFRFSHRIPCYQMNGTEREGVPEGCFELDPASLPTRM